MNKIVKYLLGFLAILIIAGAGFWGGTQFAFRQVAANSANWTTVVRPQWDGTQCGPGLAPNADNPRGRSDNDEFGRGNFGPGMMGRDNFGSNMMNRSYGGFSGMFPGGGLFGGGLMLLGLIFPLGILVLITLGIIALFRVVNRPQATLLTSASMGVCHKCGSSVQTSWTHCAACGEVL